MSDVRNNIMIDGEMRNLTAERYVTKVDEKGKALVVKTILNDWVHPTFYSKMIDVTKVFGIVAIIMIGLSFVK